MLRPIITAGIGITKTIDKPEIYTNKQLKITQYHIQSARAG